MKIFLSIIIALTSLSLVAIDADAANRMGGGRNIGKQRSDINQQQAAPKAPAQQQKQAAPAAPAQQPSGMSRWLGPLAGLALGAGLMALFMNNGIAGALGGILMIVAIIAVAVFLVRLFLRGRTAQQPLQYAAAGAEPTISPTISALPGGAGAQSVAATTNASTSQWPAGFDAAEFVRNAKLNFVRLQDAYDKRELATMRDFLTPEVYREIEADIQAAGAAPQKTDVVTLDAEVLDVSTENNLYVVSVRFSGLIREKEGGGLEPFSEIWHLQKPVSGRSGWLIAGIQQA